MDEGRVVADVNDACQRNVAIPPIDPYSVLEVRRDVTPQELKDAYRRLALLYHPERWLGGSRATRSDRPPPGSVVIVGGGGGEGGGGGGGGCVEAGHPVHPSPPRKEGGEVEEHDNNNYNNHNNNNNNNNNNQNNNGNKPDNDRQLREWRFAVISASYETLSNATHRRRYDSLTKSMKRIDPTGHLVYLAAPRTPESRGKCGVFLPASMLGSQYDGIVGGSVREPNRRQGCESSGRLASFEGASLEKERMHDEAASFVRRKSCGCLPSSPVAATFGPSDENDGMDGGGAAAGADAGANRGGTRFADKSKNLFQCRGNLQRTLSDALLEGWEGGDYHEDGWSDDVDQILYRRYHHSMDQDDSPKVHYTSAETDQMFGGPLFLLYKARNYQLFQDPDCLFESTFGANVFQRRRSGDNSGRAFDNVRFGGSVDGRSLNARPLIKDTPDRMGGGSANKIGMTMSHPPAPPSKRHKKFFLPPLSRSDIEKAFARRPVSPNNTNNNIKTARGVVGLVGSVPLERESITTKTVIVPVNADDLACDVASAYSGGAASRCASGDAASLAAASRATAVGATSSLASTVASTCTVRTTTRVTADGRVLTRTERTVVDPVTGRRTTRVAVTTREDGVGFCDDDDESRSADTTTTVGSSGESRFGGALSGWSPKRKVSQSSDDCSQCSDTKGCLADCTHFCLPMKTTVGLRASPVAGNKKGSANIVARQDVTSASHGGKKSTNTLFSDRVGDIASVFFCCGPVIP